MPPKHKVPEILIPYAALTILGSVSVFFLIFAPAAVVEIILKDFIKDCKNELLDIENNCKKLFEKYEILEKKFGNYFVSMFSTTQFILVLMTFLRKEGLKYKI